jgi:flagellar export protein FliJ
MKPAVRLDTVVKLKERDEDRARRELADAQSTAAAAARALSEAQTRARGEGRQRGTAAEWLLADSAHVRALQEVRKAETVVRAADEKVGASRLRFVGARNTAEAMRRVADARRAEVVREAESLERKQLDEVSMLLFVRS